MFLPRRARSAVPVTAVLALTLAGCDADTVTDPQVLDQADQIEFMRDITIPEFEDALANGVARIEVKLLPGELVAREVGIQGDEDLDDEEEIESYITAVTSSSITLRLGDLQVDFDDNTRFRGFDGEDMSMSDFVDLVQAELDGGRQPDVEAERNPPAEPQAPDDASFLADEIRLDRETSEAEIEINVDSDNFEANGSDGLIKVLGLMIEVQDGVTEIEHERDDLDKGKFKGAVVSVDLDASSFTLDDGTVVRVVLGTRIKSSSFGNRRLSSLKEVAAALDEGIPVHSKGKGVLEEVNPRTLVGIKVEFRVGNDELEKFDGIVEAVDVDNQTFTLEGGAVVQMAEFTQIKGQGDDDHHRAFATFDDDDDDDHEGRRLVSLEEVAAALEAGDTVRAKGKGLPSDDAAITLVAVRVEFRTKGHDDDHMDFEGIVESVDVDNGTFNLTDGTVVQLDEETKIEEDDPSHHLGSLQEVADALDAGLTVKAEGEGHVVDTDPTTILASEVEFEVDNNGGGGS